LVAAGPATRRLARELGVELQDIRGTGPEGRITRDDVQSAARQPADASHDGKTPTLPDFAHWGAVREERLNKLARTASERLSLSWRLVPHVTQHEQADITDLEAARQRLVQRRAENEPKITMTALAVKALIPVLKAYPRFNSSLDVERATLLIKEYYHVGVAVDTEDGLLVPVLRDVDKKTIRELAAELAELADTARRRQLQAGQMQGGTFTITNLGGIGGTAFTPIINYPEVAILGLSQASWQPRWIDNEPKNRLILPLSLSYDHRVINGADAARFLRKLAGLLADPLLWLVDM
jgi:pyruvate dehydrogenase E2 component (dihydrolipoyllysine-residue acetyltransferase)